VITATADVLNKLSLVGKDLTAYSLETVAMFHRDAAAAGFTIPVDASLQSTVPAAARQP
jgi:transaldolase